MKKSQLMPKTIVALIIALIGAIIMGFIIYLTILEPAKEQMFSLLCRASTLLRGNILKVILSIWNIVMIAITAFLILIGGVKVGKGIHGVYSAIKAKVFLKSALKYLSLASVGLLLSYFSITGIFTMMMINSIFPAIPLTCPVIDVHVGKENDRVSAEEFYLQTAARMKDCWDNLGSGKYDPLWGLDPPNPRICYVEHVYIKNDPNNKISFKKLFDTGADMPDWPFNVVNEETNVYFFLNEYSHGNKYSSGDWNDERYIGTSEGGAIVYIMYLDKHDYDIFSYGSNLCYGAINDYFFYGGPKKDSIVVCIED